MPHTPGPWAIGAFGLIEDQTGRRVASLAGCCGDMRANAALIAAAPEMLTLIKEMLSESYFETGFLAEALDTA